MSERSGDTVTSSESGYNDDLRIITDKLTHCISGGLHVWDRDPSDGGAVCMKCGEDFDTPVDVEEA